MTSHYSKAPITEVVCGVHFEPVAGLLSPHYGLLWETFREHGFEKLQEVPPVPPMPRSQEPGPHNQPAMPFSRIWYVRDDDAQLIQVQRDRLIFNWRKTDDEARYPGFAEVFATFSGHLRRFQTFLRAFELGDVHPLEFELSYVNHIVPTDTWSELVDVNAVFPDFAWSGDDDLLEFNWRSTLKLRETASVLAPTIRSARRSPDNSPLMLFELSAKGLSDGPDLFDSVDGWFYPTHQAIGQTFEAMTSPAIRKDWT